MMHPLLHLKTISNWFFSKQGTHQSVQTRTQHLTLVLHKWNDANGSYMKLSQLCR